MILITKRDTAIRPMHEARACGQLEMDDHFNRVGALRELRSITKLELKPSLNIIDCAIAGEELEIEPLTLYGNLELVRFVKIMDQLGFTIKESPSENIDPSEYFVKVDDEPVDDLRIEIERRILLLVRSRNQYNQSWGHPPCNIPNLVNLTDAELLDLYAEMLATNSIAIG